MCWCSKKVEENLGEKARRRFNERESPYALSNPDYVSHQFGYLKHFTEGYIEGFEECYLQLTGKSLRAELMKKIGQGSA